MGDDDPPVGDLRRHLRQPARDVFVGEAVKAVAPHALGVEALGDRVVIRDARRARDETRCRNRRPAEVAGSARRIERIGARLFG